jgi:outer membrane protein assembly factor BamB
MNYVRPEGWSLVWGGTMTETATGIAVDDSSQFVYVSGYTNSEGTLSIGKYDMLVLKVNANTGVLVWARRLGSSNNDKANGITFFNGNIYVVGDSDSLGWAISRTDMIFIKMDPMTANAVFANFLGGSAEDFGVKIQGHSDSFIYALG